MRVEQFKNNQGRPVKNQFIIYGDKSEAFQSYRSIIAIKHDSGVIEIGPDWDYSKTTGKYRNIFLGETKHETMQKIKSGEYIYNENL